jgi:hypothetical protein
LVVYSPAGISSRVDLVAAVVLDCFPSNSPGLLAPPVQAHAVRMTKAIDSHGRRTRFTTNRYICCRYLTRMLGIEALVIRVTGSEACCTFHIAYLLEPRRVRFGEYKAFCGLQGIRVCYSACSSFAEVSRRNHKEA